MRHGIRVVCGLQFQPGALGVLFQQALAFQAATYTLTDQLNQILELTFIRRFDALELRGLVVAIDVYAIQKQEVTAPVAPSLSRYPALWIRCVEIAR
jgi:hypothetical protein